MNEQAAETTGEATPLRTEQVALLLRATNSALLAETDQMRASMAAWHTAEGEWCVKECIGHMLEAERRGFAGRIRRILEEPGCRDAGWNQLEVQRLRNDCARDLSELVSEFAGERERSVELVGSLMNTDLTKACEHEQVGLLTVEDLLHEWIHHDRNHFRQIQTNVMAYVWPSMGNSKRFAEID
ncbi:MAG: DinB family protein [Candidatus Dormibacteraeota bacterium]|nr:DinB family protein [Candidatus Dormibacteraeota bacterium]